MLHMPLRFRLAGALVAAQGPLTYTCAPPGSGTRMGIDRDGDAQLDGLDNCAAASNPGQQNFDADPLGDACDADDDADGLLDGVEITNGSNPNDPMSPGPPPVPLLPVGGQLLLGGSLLVAGARALRSRRNAPSA